MGDRLRGILDKNTKLESNSRSDRSPPMAKKARFVEFVGVANQLNTTSLPAWWPLPANNHGVYTGSGKTGS